ncbi:MAG TPA: HU family DNA-binding protein [Hyphomicrobiaceae bacterium]|nr:HU family DNA-binding protein [Hyphomicrobiaceae bacterium]
MKRIEPSIPRIAHKKAAKAKTETVTLRHLATALADSHGLKKAQANTMLMDMVAVIAKHLKQGKRIKLNGLGILLVRKRPARMGRNPATGEAIKIKASKKIAFRVAKDLKQSI